MVKEYLECSVCGRKFPRGQGIVVSKSGFTLYFHSSKCASKFLRLLLERLDEECAGRSIREVLEELEEARKSRVREKKI
ncbi:MAG: hypothetical protein LRS47_00560 [Desulfurococcales archaeon]|nr:hypothetical protein [Desulfurococcales archaeon]